MKSKTTAGLLALLLGGLGAHKFYLGRGGQGIIYLLLCWTGIPVILGFIDAIVLFVMNEHDFNVKYNPGHLVAVAAQGVAQPQNIVVNVASNSSAGGGAGDLTQRLKELHDLKTSGVLTDEEFDAQKQKLLTS